jgi:hypothetical protein
MGCLLEYARIWAAFRCSSRFKMHLNPPQIGWVDTSVPAMARNTIWRGEYSMVSLLPTTCRFRHTISLARRQFASAKIYPATISIFPRSGKSDDRCLKGHEVLSLNSESAFRASRYLLRPPVEIYREVAPGLRHEFHFVTGLKLK